MLRYVRPIGNSTARGGITRAAGEPSPGLTPTRAPALEVDADVQVLGSQHEQVCERLLFRVVAERVDLLRGGRVAQKRHRERLQMLSGARLTREGQESDDPSSNFPSAPSLGLLTNPSPEACIL